MKTFQKDVILNLIKYTIGLPILIVVSIIGIGILVVEITLDEIDRDIWNDVKNFWKPY